MFTRVESNLKGLGSVELSPRMIIEAPCAGGKSAIMEACSLAVLGGVPDLEGRAWVQDASTLCESLGDETGYLWVRLYRDDGEVYSWSATGGKKLDRSRPSNVSLDDVIQVAPLYAMDRALSASDERAYQHLLSVFPVSTIAEDLPVLLGDQWAAYQALLHPDDQAELPEGAPVEATPESLMQIRDLLRERIGKAQAEVRANDQAASAISGDRPLPSDLRQAREVLAQAESGLAAILAKASRPDIRRLETQRDQVVARGKAAQAELKPLSDEITALSSRATPNRPPTSTEDRRRYAAQVLVFTRLHEIIQEKPGDTCLCPTCETPVKRVPLLARLQTLLNLSRDRAAPPPSDPNELRLKQAREREAALSKQVSDLRAEFQRVRAQIALAQEDPEESVSPEEIREKETLRDRAKTALATLNQRDAAWSTRDSLLSKARAAAQRKEADGHLAEKIDQAIDALVKRRLVAIAGKIQAHLPPDWTVALSDRPFRMGIMGPGGRRFSASGAQRNAILLAICAAAYPGALLLPAERAYDHARLIDIASSLRESNAQIFLTTTEPVREEVSGWTVCRPPVEGGAVAPPPPPTPTPNPGAKKRGRPPKKAASTEQPAAQESPQEKPPVDPAKVAEMAGRLGALLKTALDDVFAEDG